MTLQLPALPKGLGYSIASERAESDPGWYQYVLDSLPTSWFFNWTYPTIPVETGRVRAIWYTRNEPYLNKAIALANADPTAGWLIENEPEIAGQSNTPAHIAAQAMARWVAETDNPWAMGGNLWMEPFEGAAHHSGTAMEWLDAYLDAGGPVPDVWHLHTYLWNQSPESDLDAQLAVQHDWMVRRGVVRPRIITEVAWLYNHTTMQARLMRYLVKRILDNTIQAACWFCSYSATFPWSSLLTVDGALTDVGRAWLDVWDVGGQSSEYAVWLPVAMG